MVAVIESGGKQYCIQPGQKITVARVKQNVGDTVSFSDMLSGSQLSASVVAHTLDKKVVSRKFRNKTRYLRVKGHRQPVSVIEFTPTSEPTPKKTTKKQENGESK